MEIIPGNSTPWECYGEIQCVCNQNILPISYPSDYPNEIQEDFPEENINVIFTSTYTYPIEIYEENIHIKSVITYQPIEKEGSKCTFECNIENYHIHTYCSSCKKNLPYRIVIHKCEIGINKKQI